MSTSPGNAPGIRRARRAAFAAAVAGLAALAAGSSSASAGVSEAECLRRVQAARTAVMRENGGDDVNFNFFKRADAAEALCRSGRSGEAMSIVAAIKSDLRGLINERYDFN